MTQFLRQLTPSVHTGRQFVTAQHLTVLEGTLSLHDYLKQVGERAALSAIWVSPQNPLTGCG
ncbi:hypothetical protein Ppb6_01300 [Photorhabdus australis subsp. thailandensis]|uniref:Uncharacterized protein n=1 Tax=Photorhabdus australis subsp. thailandensis TaxID=2805096 RepID=A0A1C0U6F2_9GAMM|nr:hypothetical protein [Photorhabdus australis]OCQ53499.1 hypothetical protein Ppb6_01300 [Photorhabdus australis subsp. thailandensis]